MKQTIGLISLAAAMGLASASASVDCLALSLRIKHESSVNQSGVLELVSAELAAAPGCACEIVKAAIEGTKADPKMVASIVQTASNVVPEQLRLISQCAVAVAPDSLVEVQAVVAMLDPNLGETASANSAKGAKAPAGEVAAMPNPLDFPGQGPVGPRAGEQGGASLIGPGPSSILPLGAPVNVIPPLVPKPPVVVPPVTGVNP